jgi:hypothetical protein
MEYEAQERNAEASELLKKTESLKAKFVSPEVAIKFYLHRLEDISTARKCTVAELIILAENSNCSDEISFEVLSLARKIQVLKKILG